MSHDYSTLFAMVMSALHSGKWWLSSYMFPELIAPEFKDSLPRDIASVIEQTPLEEESGDSEDDEDSEYTDGDPDENTSAETDGEYDDDAKGRIIDRQTACGEGD